MASLDAVLSEKLVGAVEVHSLESDAFSAVAPEEGGRRRLNGIVLAQVYHSLAQSHMGLPQELMLARHSKCLSSVQFSLSSVSFPHV